MKALLGKLDNPVVFIILVTFAVGLPLYLATMVYHKLGIPGPASLAA